jgi:hypothetical protein
VREGVPCCVAVRGVEDPAFYEGLQVLCCRCGVGVGAEVGVGCQGESGREHRSPWFVFAASQVDELLDGVFGERHVGGRPADGCEEGGDVVLPGFPGGCRCDHGRGALAVVEHEVGDDGDLAAVEHPLADAPVRADVVQGFLPAALGGEGAGAVGEGHPPEPGEYVLGTVVCGKERGGDADVVDGDVGAGADRGGEVGQGCARLVGCAGAGA